MNHAIVTALKETQPRFVAIRHDIHSHPELGLQEHRTAELVIEKLHEWGIEVYKNIGKTGVVGVLRRGNSNRSIGLRADMDALPLQEDSGVAWRSQTAGMMHACGHDGHTTMLLAAAHHLVETRNFNGTVNFIFQPGEEGCGGAEAMLKDGLFDRFPCDSVYGLHNQPGLPVGHYQMTSGTAMTGGTFFDITLTGVGAHAARPEASVDPVIAVCQLASALQTIVSRIASPQETVVFSITKLAGGNANNVIPQSASLGGTFRCMSREMMTLVRERMERMTHEIAAAFGVTSEISYAGIFAPLVNDPEKTELAASIAETLTGPASVNAKAPPVTGSEDFSFMLERVPGAFIRIGNGDSAGLHNPAYDFNDDAIPYGAGLLVGLVEKSLCQEELS
ncbi:MAG: M20 family metallopeptidase [Acetobacter sp.]|jgi:hippurate hydrolase|nr:M20 family metallopeptidase [Acetobacter sp.]MCH4061990.1 M20 family metallopeptidase [Acetobacter sp.]MCH4089161.1 M20 family metallopeptidase [Acetobacter sp.]MCI1293667.1 M20 family metallopeptidase [Acetobacter sp.]MCI1320252.1 M20 family metallopeptidase [Acetobacter sp.]